jgi:hypothetical protein
MCTWDPWISNFGAILSNSFVNAPSIETGEEPPVKPATEVDVEYLRCLTCSNWGRQTWSLRVAEHLMILLTIIASSQN